MSLVERLMESFPVVDDRALPDFILMFQGEPEASFVSDVVNWTDVPASRIEEMGSRGGGMMLSFMPQDMFASYIAGWMLAAASNDFDRSSCMETLLVILDPEYADFHEDPPYGENEFLRRVRSLDKAKSEAVLSFLLLAYERKGTDRDMGPHLRRALKFWRARIDRWPEMPDPENP